jgi:sugar phosphate isomerase/epimerase
MAKTGLQLYSIKEISTINLFDAIKLASDSGYDGVEFAGFFDVPAKDVKRYMDSIGMLPCGSHTGIGPLENDLDKIMEYNLEIGNDFIVVPSLPEEMRNSRKAWLETAEKFNRLNEKITKNGLKLGYHNHAFEFELFDGDYGFDIFAGNTSDEIILEIDTYWVEHPGLSSTEYVKKYIKLTIFNKNTKN